MADPAKRSSRYADKTTASRTSGIVTDRLGEMTTNFTGTANELVQIEQQIRQTVNAAGVPTIQYPFYLNFGRELWSRIRKGMSGESLRVEAALLIAKWVATGLVQSVLEAIRSEVFNLGAPTSP